MIHPPDEKLIELAGAPTGSRSTSPEWEAHIGGCPHCQARIEEFRQWDKAAAASMAEGLPPKAAAALANLIRRIRPIRPMRPIPLHPMPIPAQSEPVRLAADGHPAESPGLRHRATLYSEDPELVLRVMHDPASGRDTLHLLGAESHLTENVLLHIENPSLDFVTGSDGTVQIEKGILPDPAALKWQVRLPDATFLLHPLPDEPPAGTESPEVELETESAQGEHGAGRIAVALTHAADGLNLRVRVLHIEGYDRLERLRVVVSQSGGISQVIETGAADPAVISGLAPNQWINIRIFAIP